MCNMTCKVIPGQVWFSLGVLPPAFYGASDGGGAFGGAEREQEESGAARLLDASGAAGLMSAAGQHDHGFAELGTQVGDKGQAALGDPGRFFQGV